MSGLTYKNYPSEPIPFVARASGFDIGATLQKPVSEEGLPVVLAPGWSEGQTALSCLRRAFALQGRPTITLDHPRGFGGHLFDANVQRSIDLHAVMKQAAGDFGFSEFDVVGHSLGGIDAVNVASHEGENINSITLVASAGLIEGDNPFKILTRLVRQGEIGHFIQAPSKWAIALNGISNVLANPVRSTAEGIHAGFDVRDRVSELGSFGMKVARLQFAKDRIFELEKVDASMATLNHHIAAVHSDETAGHNATVHTPHEVATSVLSLIAQHDRVKVAS